MKQTLYQILGVEPTATEKQIKDAHRKLVKQYHPDKNSGDKEAEAKFKEIQEAYDILSDPERKLKYDQTGSTEQDNTDQRITNFFAAYIVPNILATNENLLDTKNMVNVMKDVVNKMIRDAKDALKLAEDEQKKIEKFLSKVVLKEGRVDKMLFLFENRIESSKAAIAAIKDEIEFMNEMLGIIDNYTYILPEKIENIKPKQSSIGRFNLNEYVKNNFFKED